MLFGTDPFARSRIVANQSIEWFKSGLIGVSDRFVEVNNKGTLIKSSRPKLPELPVLNEIGYHLFSEP